jgi:hypothetical protein
LIGTTQQGTIKITDPIDGEMVYRVRANTLQVFVTDKPFVVPCFKIQAKMTEGVDAAIAEVAAQGPSEPPQETPDTDDDDEATPPDEPPESPDDSTPAPIERPSVTWTTAELQRRLIASGAPDIEALKDGQFGPTTRTAARKVFAALGFSNVSLVSASGGRQVRIAPIDAANALREATAPNGAPSARGGAKGTLILVGLAGIVIAGLAFMRRQEES